MSTSTSLSLELFVPGRICLFGEHSDWAGGFRKENPDIPIGKCLLSGTNQGIYARVAPRPAKLHLKSILDHVGTMEEIEIPFEDDLLYQHATSKTSIWRYICGVSFQMKQRFPVIDGIMLDNFKTTLPVKKGLSSSAAICVLVARAFNQIYDLKLSIRDEMEFAFLGERTTPSKCGRMDQGCAYGVKPILMKFDGDVLEVEETIHVGSPIHMILVDLHASKDTASILADLQTAYPHPKCETSKGLHALLGEMNHAIMEEAMDALSRGCAVTLGATMTKAQKAFDDYAIPVSPKHLSSPVLHRLLTHEPLQQYVYGGKGVGSQGDGSAQFVAKSAEDQQAAIKLIETEFGMTCIPLTLEASS
jgi:mevalonate kinase